MSLPNPSPRPSSENQRFWDATTENRLELPRCSSCGRVIWYPREICPDCHGTDIEWFEASGQGTIYSCTTTRRMPGRWGGAAPFVLAYVELDEGPRLMTNIVDCDPDEIAIGDRVEAVFHPTEDGPALVRFRPAG